MSKIFRLRYLPLFEQDLTAVYDYIAGHLQNLAAALRLLDDTEAAILKRLENPLGFEPYQSNRERKYPYYRIRIRNFTVFYVVIEDVMEVRRFLYNKQNILEIL